MQKRSKLRGLDSCLKFAKGPVPSASLMIDFLPYILLVFRCEDDAVLIVGGKGIQRPSWLLTSHAKEHGHEMGTGIPCGSYCSTAK